MAVLRDDICCFLYPRLLDGNETYLRRFGGEYVPKLPPDRPAPDESFLQYLRRRRNARSA